MVLTDNSIQAVIQDKILLSFFSNNRLKFLLKKGLLPI